MIIMIVMIIIIMVKITMIDDRELDGTVGPCIAINQYDDCDDHYNDYEGGLIDWANFQSHSHLSIFTFWHKSKSPEGLKSSINILPKYTNIRSANNWKYPNPNSSIYESTDTDEMHEKWKSVWLEGRIYWSKENTCCARQQPSIQEL